MKTYKTDKVQVDELTWKPNFNYSECISRDVEYSYESTKYIRVWLNILTTITVLALGFICIYFANIWNLDNWRAFLWVLSFGIVEVGIAILSSEIVEDAEKQEESFKRDAKNVTRARYNDTFKSIEKIRDEWRQTHKLESYAKDFVEGLISTDHFMELYNELNDENKQNIKCLIDEYISYRLAR